MSAIDRKRCACGIYIDCHDRCDHTPRKRRWWHEAAEHHWYWPHLAARAWLAIPSRTRWAVMVAIDDATGKRFCWCDLADAALKADWYRPCDYVGPHACLCDLPLPLPPYTAPQPEGCYCPPGGRR